MGLLGKFQICLGLGFNRPDGTLCFVLFAPGDESPGYCHGCPACAEAFCLRQGSGRQAAGRPLMGHQNRFRLALMPLAGGVLGTERFYRD